MEATYPRVYRIKRSTRILFVLLFGPVLAVGFSLGVLLRTGLGGSASIGPNLGGMGAMFVFAGGFFLPGVLRAGIVLDETSIQSRFLLFSNVLSRNDILGWRSRYAQGRGGIFGFIQTDQGSTKS